MSEKGKERDQQPSDDKVVELLSKLYEKDPEVAEKVPVSQIAETMSKISTTPDLGESVEELQATKLRILALDDANNQPIIEGIDRQIKIAQERENLSNQRKAKAEARRLSRREFLSNVSLIGSLSILGTAVVGGIASGVIHALDSSTADIQAWEAAIKKVEEGCKTNPSQDFCPQDLDPAQFGTLKEYYEQQKANTERQIKKDRLVSNLSLEYKPLFTKRVFNEDLNSPRNIIRDHGWKSVPGAIALFFTVMLIDEAIN